MVHNAYDLFQLLTNSPTKILSAAVYNSKLLLGCTDGSLKIYAPESSSSSSSSVEQSLPSDRHQLETLEFGIKRETYVLEKTLKGFWKKALVSMEVSQSRSVLISLSESITVHRVPNLEAVAVISKAKGATVFAWDDQRGLLCFGRQKRVGIFRLEGGQDFVEVKDFGVPDVVKSMAWCGDNICLGIRKEYVILNSTTGVLTEVFPSGRIAPPLVVSLPSGELLLGKDNIGVFVDQNGKLLQDGRISWSEAPTSVVIHMQYAIAHLPRHIEIRSLRVPYPLVQTVVLRDVHLLKSNNNIIVVLDNSIIGLLPVPLGAQIVQLTASGNFEEALALCKLLPPEDSKLRVAKEGSIHIRYGHYLFDNESYEEAMEQFLASSVDITYVLSLYPSIVLPKTLSVTEPQIAGDLASDAFDLSRVSSDASDEMDASSPSHLESDEKTNSTKTSYNALMALVKFLQNKRNNIIEKATAEVTEEVVSNAVEYSSRSHHSSRSKNSSKSRHHIHVSSGAREMAAILDTALLQVMVLTGQSSASLDLLKGLNYCDVKICEEFLQQRNYYSALLELYKCNEMHREALKLLNQLVEESNLVEPPSELTQKFKPEMIIEYLKPLCSTDPMLVLEYSMHVLESCPAQTIELLSSGNIPADLVNSYLKQHAPEMQGTYLELMISMNESGISPNLRNELVQIYLSEVLNWYADLMTQKKWDEKCYSPTRKKLLSALENISGYNPEAVLKRLPADALYEERAILLGMMNQHQLALSLYVHKLHVPELAVAYCDRVYEGWQHQRSSKSSSNIYLTLLQIYLNPQRKTKEFESALVNLDLPQSTDSQKVGSTKAKVGRVAKKIAQIESAEDLRFRSSSIDSGRSDYEGDEVDEPNQEGGPIMLDEALDLLGRRWDKINGAQALKLLPRETKLQNLLSFLEPLVKKSSEGRRNFSVIKSLRYSENLQVKEELYKQRKAVVKITSDSMCSLCKKRLGTSVFAVYPNGTTLVHFVCFRDSQSIKAVRGASLRNRG
ncbi:Clathrin [Macleaya cordata]|uniref:Clathrin n=1 Tax=Macleaya cordata TaxID=56857 RepID=A0A200Q3X0_MACCD|nr:Clathrin [Macleaya cordata]